MKTPILKIIFPLFCYFLTTSVSAVTANAPGVSMYSFSGGDTCLKKKFSVVFYAIQDSSLSLTHAKVNAMTASLITDLNQAFDPICVSFVNCSTVIIPHTPFNSWKESIDPTVTGSWRTENTINIYIADTVYYMPAKEQAGYAHGIGIQGTYTSYNTDVIVLSRLAKPNYVSKYGTIQHNMGHLFGLHDTYSEISIPSTTGSLELVDKSNCGTKGDGICDTSADPFPAGTLKDQNSQFYTPPADNFMSMYETRCRFTPNQYYFMAKYIMKYKMYLH